MQKKSNDDDDDDNDIIMNGKRTLCVSFSFLFHCS